MEDPYPNMFKLQEYHFNHLPVWINGNAYFNGAKKWNREASALVDQEHEIYVHLVEKDDEYRIDTNVYEFLNGFKNGIISNDILGEAFEPEERFENPDGSDIVFDSDYLGDHRGAYTIPGPFATAEADQKVIW